MLTKTSNMIDSLPHASCKSLQVDSYSWVESKYLALKVVDQSDSLRYVCTRSCWSSTTIMFCSYNVIVSVLEHKSTVWSFMKQSWQSKKEESVITLLGECTDRLLSCYFGNFEWSFAKHWIHIFYDLQVLLTHLLNIVCKPVSVSLTCCCLSFKANLVMLTVCTVIALNKYLWQFSRSYSIHNAAGFFVFWVEDELMDGWWH